MLQHACKPDTVPWLHNYHQPDETDYQRLLRHTQDAVVINKFYLIENLSRTPNELTQSFSLLYRRLLAKPELPLRSAVENSFRVFEAQGRTLINGGLVVRADQLDPALPKIDTTARIKDLKDIAGEDDIEWSQESEAAFKRFVARAKPTRAPSLFLTERGTLRAVWADEKGQQAAFHFVDATKIQVVYFVLRSEGTMARTSGIDTLDGAIEQISASGLLSLLR